MVDWDALKAVETLIREYQADIADRPVPAVVMKPCLKRIHKSIERWNKRSGRQGYLDFISEFIT